MRIELCSGGRRRRCMERACCCACMWCGSSLLSSQHQLSQLSMHAHVSMPSRLCYACTMCMFVRQGGSVTYTVHVQLERQRHTTVNVTSSIVPPPQDRDAWQEKPDLQQFITSLITYVYVCTCLENLMMRHCDDYLACVQHCVQPASSFTFIQFCLIRTGVYQIIWHFAPSLQAGCDDYYQLNGIMHGSRWS